MTSSSPKSNCVDGEDDWHAGQEPMPHNQCYSEPEVWWTISVMACYKI